MKNNQLPIQFSMDGHCAKIAWPKVQVKTPEARGAFVNARDPEESHALLDAIDGHGKLASRKIIRAVRSYPDGCIPLLSFGGRNPSLFTYLYEQSPALCYEVARRSWLNPSFDVHRSMPQRQWWDLLHKVRSRSFARQMARIPARAMSPDLVTILSMRWINSRRLRRLLPHVPTINPPVLECILRLHDDALLPNLLLLASREPDDSQAPRLMAELYRNWMMLAPDKSFEFSQITSSEQLARAQQRLENRICETEFFYEQFFDSPFPDPPFEANEEVKPIVHPADLSDTARAFGNCLRLYAMRISRGYAYAYSVPNAFLVILVEKIHGSWQISAVEGPDGQTANGTDMEIVETWWKEVAQ